MRVIEEREKEWPREPSGKKHILTKAESMLNVIEDLNLRRNSDTETAAWVILACASEDGAHAARKAVELGFPVGEMATRALMADAWPALKASFELGADPKDVPCSISSNALRESYEVALMHDAGRCYEGLLEMFPKERGKMLRAAVKNKRKRCGETAAREASPEDAKWALVEACAGAGKHRHSGENWELSDVIAALAERGALVTDDGAAGVMELTRRLADALRERGEYDAREIKRVLYGVEGWWALTGNDGETPLSILLKDRRLLSNEHGCATEVERVLREMILEEDPDLASSSECADLAALTAVKAGGTTFLTLFEEGGARVSEDCARRVISEVCPGRKEDLWRTEGGMEVARMTARMFSSEASALVARIDMERAHTRARDKDMSYAGKKVPQTWSQEETAQWEAMACEAAALSEEGRPTRAPRRI